VWPTSWETILHADRTFLRHWLFGLLSCTVLLGGAIEFADRPISSFSHAHFHRVAYFVWLTYIPEGFAVIAAVALAVFAVALAAGRRPGAVGTVLVRCSVSLVAAEAVKDQLKYAFGRTWPETWTHSNPSFITNGVFGFNPFHGGAGFASFPSGHTTATCAVLSVLWLAWPRFRWLYVLVGLAVVAGLLGADYHWLSDTIGGAYLGVATGVTATVAGREAAAR
jgi:membrane-associated phospholipid phosphatase